MCTVAFLPAPRGSYLLAHNRDERLSRSPGLAPRRRTREGLAVLAPQDPDGGGTWIAVNAAGVTLCILNAAERAPRRLPAAPRSRGLILWDNLGVRSLDELRARFHPNVRDLSDVRAFHLVAAAPGAGRRPARILRMRWDGVRIDWCERRDPALFVSSGVDPRGARRDREAAWRGFLRAVPRPDAGRLSDWMANHEPERGPTSVCMHRAEVATVSRTIVSVARPEIELRYTAGAPCDAGARVTTRRLRA